MKYLFTLMGRLLALAMLVVLPVSLAHAEPPLIPPGLERAAAAQKRHTNRLLTLPRIQGTAVGITGDGRSVVKIYTDEPGVTGLPKDLDGVPVLVEVTGKIVALGHRAGHERKQPKRNGRAKADPTQRFERPVPIGVSTGHPDITAGTIGVRVVRENDVYALSNNHVYANSNIARIGDNVLQPGAFDGGTDPADAIGMLADFEAIDFSPGAVNVMDAAVALSSTDLLGRATPLDGYGLPSTTPMLTPFIGQRVLKYGRTTRETRGFVTGLNATIQVAYPTGTALFVNQIVIESTRRNRAFSGGGDSGSLIVSNEADTHRQAVGLLFAGAEFLGRDFSFANPIGPILTRFQVTIDGEQ